MRNPTAPPLPPPHPPPPSRPARVIPVLPPPLRPIQLAVGMQKIHSIRVVFLAMGVEFCFRRFWLWIWLYSYGYGPFECLLVNDT